GYNVTRDSVAGARSRAEGDSRSDVATAEGGVSVLRALRTSAWARMSIRSKQDIAALSSRTPAATAKTATCRCRVTGDFRGIRQEQVPSATSRVAVHWRR